MTVLGLYTASVSSHALGISMAATAHVASGLKLEHIEQLCHSLLTNDLFLHASHCMTPVPC